MFHDKSLHFADAFRNSGLLTEALGTATTGAPILRADELLDLYGLIDDAARRRLVPFLEPGYYRQFRGIGSGDPINLLEDFFLHGFEQDVSPHPLIDLSYIRAQRPQIFASSDTFARFFEALTANQVDPSPFFSGLHYAMQRGARCEGSLLLDFLEQGAAQRISPNPYFDVDAYRTAYPDAPREALAATLHYVSTGDREGRAPGPGFDADWYSRTYGAAVDLTDGPLHHYLRYGRHMGFAPTADCKTAARGTALTAPAAESGADFQHCPDAETVLSHYASLKAQIADLRAARLDAFEERDIRPIQETGGRALLEGLAFQPTDAPLIDVIIPCYNEFERTVECLASLSLALGATPARVMVVDDTSPDDRLALLGAVPGLEYHRNAENLHFLKTCNAAYARGSAPYVLLLNNDTQVIGPAIDRLLAALDGDPSIAAAAPMILYPNGRLQEAGCVIGAQGSSQMVGLFDDPDLPQYGVDRDIDYGSAACLLVRRADVGGALFDDRFAPAYCEDADLCLRLRSQGKRIRYVAGARIIHHLSASTSAMSERRRIQLVGRNQQKLQAKWGEAIATSRAVRTLAFYLPQFHPIEQNDFWWGKGFSEWTNVTKAKPSFVGHYQPHLPADLGFYDLRLLDVMLAQQQLARRYGVHGFVMYYYNFQGGRVLGRPLENLLNAPDADFRFCLCWANENWTKHWDGGTTRHILMEQDYGPDTLARVTDDAIAAARHAGAITIHGAPLFLIYRPLLLPDSVRITETIRAAFRRAGFPDVHLAYVESMETAQSDTPPSVLGFDSSVEFPPQGTAAPYEGGIVRRKRDYAGTVYDYAATVVNAAARQNPGYRRFPCVFPSWDNTARQPLKHAAFQGATPERFQAYVEAKLEQIDMSLSGEERLLFVNAWNEWAEGAHLEPDRAFGHDWLQALAAGMRQQGCPAVP